MDDSKDWISEAEALDDMLENGDEDDRNFLPIRSNPFTRTIAQVQGLTAAESVALYEKAKATKTGETCTCPRCSKPFQKKSYQQAFCSNKGPGNCKDIFWNVVRPERAQRAKHFARRG